VLIYTLVGGFNPLNISVTWDDNRWDKILIVVET